MGGKSAEGVRQAERDLPPDEFITRPKPKITWN